MENPMVLREKHLQIGYKWWIFCWGMVLGKNTVPNVRSRCFHGLNLIVGRTLPKEQDSSPLAVPLSRGLNPQLRATSGVVNFYGHPDVDLNIRDPHG